MNFQISAIDQGLFKHYFSMTRAELHAAGASLFEADQSPEYPCRVSLTDAEIGETVLALPYCHHPVNGPYRSSGPIFVRANGATARLQVNEVPQLLRHRILSVRGYDAAHTMIEADNAMGGQIENLIRRQLQNDQVAYLHIHYAKPGCFSCAVDRV